MSNCNKCLYFEARKKKDLYLWMTNVPMGPSVKFLVQNIHTMLELKMTGNSLKGSRPLLAFDEELSSNPQWKLIMEQLKQIFSTPNEHPKSQPFIDHVFSFSLHDGAIWFRNYQIIHQQNRLEEIGPRFVLKPICILDGSFGGPVLYENPDYVSPNTSRRQKRQEDKDRYLEKAKHKQRSKRENKVRTQIPDDPTEDVFEPDLPNPLKRKINRPPRRTKKPRF